VASPEALWRLGKLLGRELDSDAIGFGERTRGAVLRRRGLVLELRALGVARWEVAALLGVKESAVQSVVKRANRVRRAAGLGVGVGGVDIDGRGCVVVSGEV
jgi:hypothetical protein